MTETTTTPPEFSLVHDPWIPTIDGDISLIDLLTHGRDIDYITSGNPATDVAILRYALAVIYRAYGLYSDCAGDEDTALDTWEKVWHADSFYTDEVAHYLDEHGETMTLRNLLVPEMENQKGVWHNPSSLYPSRPLFPSNVPNELTPAEAVRAVLYVNAWDTAGIKTGALGDDRASNGRIYGATVGSLGWAGASTLHGENMHETLCLNWVATKCDKNDAPSWEHAPFPVGARYGDDYRPGPAGLMTWHTRRVNMNWRDGRAVGVMVSRGDNLMVTAYDGAETMANFNLNKDRTKKSAVPVYTPSPMYAPECTWRCAGGILPSSPRDIVKSGVGEGSPTSRPPETTRFIGMVSDEGILPDGFVPRMSHINFAYGTKFAVIDEARLTLFPVPSAVLGTGDTAHTASAAVEYTAETVAKAIRSFVWAVDIASGGSGDFDKRSLAAQTTSLYRALSDQFNRWLQTMQSGGVGELERWKHESRARVLSVARTIAQQSPTTAFIGTEYDGRVYTATSALDTLGRQLTPTHEGEK